MLDLSEAYVETVQGFGGELFRPNETKGFSVGRRVEGFGAHPRTQVSKFSGEKSSKNASFSLKFKNKEILEVFHIFQTEFCRN